MSSIGEYRDSHKRCAVCHWPDGRGTPLQVHHIWGRRGKSKEVWDDERNLLVLCSDCHHGVHSGGGCSLSLGNVLFAKSDADGHVDIAFLASLKGRVGLPEDPEPLPQWAIDARIDNRSAGWWRKP